MQYMYIFAHYACTPVRVSIRPSVCVCVCLFCFLYTSAYGATGHEIWEMHACSRAEKRANLLYAYTRTRSLTTTTTKCIYMCVHLFVSASSALLLRWAPAIRARARAHAYFKSKNGMQELCVWVCVFACLFRVCVRARVRKISLSVWRPQALYDVVKAHVFTEPVYIYTYT